MPLLACGLQPLAAPCHNHRARPVHSTSCLHSQDSLPPSVFPAFKAVCPCALHAPSCSAPCSPDELSECPVLYPSCISVLILAACHCLAYCSRFCCTYSNSPICVLPCHLSRFVLLCIPAPPFSHTPGGARFWRVCKEQSLSRRRVAHMSSVKVQTLCQELSRDGRVLAQNEQETLQQQKRAEQRR